MYFIEASIIPVSHCSGVNPGEEAGPVLARGWQPSHPYRVLSWDSPSSPGTAIVSGSWPQFITAGGNQLHTLSQFRYLWFSSSSLCSHWVLVTHPEIPLPASNNGNWEAAGFTYCYLYLSLCHLSNETNRLKHMAKIRKHLDNAL